MNTNSKINDVPIEPEFAELFEFPSSKDELKHEARMIMYRFLSEIERISGDMSKKELAKLIGTSASFVTQLFNGDKLINLLTVAKLQRAFQIQFSIEAKQAQDTFAVVVPPVRSDRKIEYGGPAVANWSTIRLERLTMNDQPYKPLTAA